MLSPEELKIVEFGKKQGKSASDVANAVANYRASVTTKEAPKQEEKGLLSRIGTSLSKRFGDVKESFKKEVTEEGTPLGGIRLGLRTAGAVAGGITDVAGETLKSVGDVTGVTEGVKSVAKPIGLAILDTDSGKAGLNAIKSGAESYGAFKQANPDTANALEDVVNIASLLPVGAGTKIAGQGALDVTKGALKTGGDIIKTGIKAIEPIIDTTGKVVKGVKDVSAMTAEGVGRIPSRIATNVAEKQATRESIAQLPTKIAKQAVQDGADIADIKYLYTIPKEQKTPLRTLLKSAQDFESGVSKTNPIEIVGKPIVNRIKQLESARGTIGQKLGMVADTLGNVTTKEVYPSVFDSLKKVQGLNGLKVNKKGVLDFTDTVLTTEGSASDRKAIQSIFADAVKSGTGKQKHLLRQELFEILGGKKKSLTALTDTQEKAYEAIRKGLSDVLDTKNVNYKALNAEYAKVAQPLSDMRKFMKSVPGATEDILDMQAGLLARRLTSNASSNPQIRAILKSLDNATAVKGKAQLSVENLQDFYNVLDKYYDIAGKTGLQKQVQAGVEKAGGITDYLMQTVGGFAGKSDAVKRKAIESALMEALK